MIGEARDVVLQVFKDLLGVPVVWDGKAEPAMFGQKRALARLSMKSVVDIGVPDERSIFNETTEGLDTDLTTYKVFTLSVSLECYQQQEAYEILETARLRIRRERYLGPLRDVEIALVNVLPCINLNLIREQHVISYAVMDLRLAMTLTDSERALAGQGWIETAEISNEVESDS